MWAMARFSTLVRCARYFQFNCNWSQVCELDLHYLPHCRRLGVVEGQVQLNFLNNRFSGVRLWSVVRCVLNTKQRFCVQFMCRPRNSVTWNFIFCFWCRLFLLNITVTRFLDCSGRFFVALLPRVFCSVRTIYFKVPPMKLHYRYNGGEMRDYVTWETSGRLCVWQITRKITLKS